MYSFDGIEKAAIDRSFNFKLEGFADEPNVYLRTTIEGLELGFETIFWHGQVPSPSSVKKHLVTWDTFHSLGREQQLELILELLMKTINSRKRQYRKCQSCASKHLGTVF